MITVPQATEKIILRSRYLSEAIAKNLINVSSLADYIHPEVESIVMKRVTRGSIIMAIKRLRASLKPQMKQAVTFEEPPDMIVRSNQTLYFVKNSPSLLKKLTAIKQVSETVQKKALFSHGRVETMVLVNKITVSELEPVFSDEDVLSRFSEVASITIHLPQDASLKPGVFYFFLKSLAWENINLLGILTTYAEVTLIFKNEDVHTAFGILQSLFTVSHNR